MKKSGNSLIILCTLAVVLIGALPDIGGAITITEFPLPFPFSVPVGITAGPVGNGNVWFTEQSGNVIGQITPAGSITEFEVPPNPTAFNVPLGITTGPDNNLWFTESFAASIGQITPSGIVSDFPISTYSQPFWIASGPDGNLWFTEESFPGDSGLIGRITPAGVITEFPVPTTNSQPFGITTGPDGNLWFTEGNGNNIALATITNGAIPTPTAQLSFEQSPVVSPVISTAVSQGVSSVDIIEGTMRVSSLANTENLSMLAPIGIGPVAAGGSIFTLRVGLGQFSGAVDIYFALAAPAIDPVNIYILTPTGLQTFAHAGLVPWISNTLGGIYVAPFLLLEEFPISQLPPGTYTFYVVVTPTGSISTYYFWQTSFVR
ncbi:MAG TPA: hypothetical protein VFG09_09505 [Thermodesulfovibrionales bacterium]|nr:hypothetical protein [Thermodesulfovibrionales bacterium]